MATDNSSLKYYTADLSSISSNRWPQVSVLSILFLFDLIIVIIIIIIIITMTIIIIVIIAITIIRILLIFFFWDRNSFMLFAYGDAMVEKRP